MFYLAIAIFGIAGQLWRRPNKAPSCCLCWAMIPAFFPGLVLVISWHMQYLTGVRISGFPALLDPNAINETPASLYVGYEAAVSLKIVVKARSLQCLVFFLHNCLCFAMFSDLWTWSSECAISAIAGGTGIREQTMAPRLRCCLEERKTLIFCNMFFIKEELSLNFRCKRRETCSRNGQICFTFLSVCSAAVSALL